MRSIPSILALALIGSVATMDAGAEPSSVERTYVGTSKAEVWQAVVTTLEANGLPVTAESFEHGEIRARRHDDFERRWAACPKLDTRSFDPLSPANLGVRSSPLYRGVDLRLEITETTTGTRLTLDPRYFDVGRDNGRRAFAVQISCRSTGVLEQALFTSVTNP